jgi:hypothetical protein
MDRKLEQIINGAMQQPQGPPAMQIASPINDAQLVSIIAAIRMKDKPDGAVKEAMEIVAETVVQMDNGQALMKLVQAKQVLKQ